MEAGAQRTQGPVMNWGRSGVCFSLAFPWLHQPCSLSTVLPSYQSSISGNRTGGAALQTGCKKQPQIKPKGWGTLLPLPSCGSAGIPQVLSEVWVITAQRRTFTLSSQMRLAVQHFISFKPCVLYQLVSSSLLCCRPSVRHGLTPSGVVCRSHPEVAGAGPQ